MDTITTYKLSKYNYLIDYNDKKLLFNGLAGSGFCMTLQEFEKLESLLLDLAFFQKQHPEDFERLKNLGYIIENDFDEIAFIKFSNRKTILLNKSYRLIINPTLECNFNCWYCYEDHIQGHMSSETIDKIKKHITQKIEDREISSLNLSWFGGEPLLYFNEVIYSLTKFAKEICEENHITFMSNITTNGFCINDDMTNLFNEIKLTSFQITLDGHREKHNKIRNVKGEPSYDKIINNINLLCEKVEGISITLRINYDNQTLKTSEVVEILNDIEQNNRDKIRIDLHRVWQTVNKTEKNVNYLSAFINKAKSAGYKNVMYAGALLPRQYYNCYASKYHYLGINFDGKIFKCTARGFSDNYTYGEILDNGSIKWDVKRLCKLYDKPTFDNPMCLDCKYLPLCWGPCPQKILETPKDKIQNLCILKLIERTINERIIDLYEGLIRNVQLIM